jgi:hypothetical protein
MTLGALWRRPPRDCVGRHCRGAVVVAAAAIAIRTTALVYLWRGDVYGLFVVVASKKCPRV